MGFLSRQPDDEDGQPLGLRPVRSFLPRDEASRTTPGGQRPQVVDTSRPGNEPEGGGAFTSWSRAKPAATEAEPTRDREAIQADYESLFQ